MNDDACGEHGSVFMDPNNMILRVDSSTFLVSHPTILWPGHVRLHMLNYWRNKSNPNHTFIGSTFLHWGISRSLILLLLYYYYKSTLEVDGFFHIIVVLLMQNSPFETWDVEWSKSCYPIHVIFYIILQLYMWCNVSNRQDNPQFF